MRGGDILKYPWLATCFLKWSLVDNNCLLFYLLLKSFVTFFFFAIDTYEDKDLSLTHI